MVIHDKQELINTVKKLTERLYKIEPTLKKNLYLLPNNEDFNKEYNEKNVYINTDDDNKFITFIMCLKNRPNRAKLSIENLINEETAKYCKFIIVEDVSENLLKLDNFKYKKYIEHYLVKTDVNWSRSKLLNYGIKRSDTNLVAMWDCDFLFPENFVNNLKNICQYIDFKKYFFAINSFETHTTNVRGTIFKQGDPYGYMWVYDRQSLFDVKAFHEMMKDHGWEERYLQDKLRNTKKMKTVYSYKLNKEMIVFHYSHSTDIRGKFGTISNQKVKNKVYDIWGEQILLKKYNYL